ncbi:MAG: polysaccharide biosynthesis protein, partial [Oscillospiraceae bacterium]|nr:polysaccharide biosynthesis protein [Oscillospiraceae bacterium]
AGYIEGKTVLVTGGGGSIGSELCRQIAAHNPGRLLVFDICENGAYTIQQELHKRYPDLRMDVLIGSIRDSVRLRSVFETYKPEIVYHAAAHKHVPLMEYSPEEAVKNNVFGTRNLCQFADSFGAEIFVQISTDKAVNPTNVMGATKRICEMIVQSFSRRSKTKFVCVRFGNVLGSSGSVVPLFRRQIEEGGPVTVTHKDVIRYFMTIPEAVSLVMQAGAYAENGEIFVLDMGDPVRIDDLARNMIRLSGFKPDTDIKIKYVGLRPGEKLYEELLLNEEGMRSTANHLIFICRPLDIDEEVFWRQLDEMETMCREPEADVRSMLKKIVPTYHPENGGAAAAKAKQAYRDTY